MALQTSQSIPVPVDGYDRLHLRSLNVKTSGEVDDVKFAIAATFRRYARGADTGQTDVTGSPIYAKHWMPTDQPNSTVTISITDIESWAIAQATAGNLIGAGAVNNCLDSVEVALAAILEVEHSALGTVEVV